MVFLKSIAHSRIQTFMDLFLIIAITKVFFQYIGTKWIFVLMIIQVCLWSQFAYTWHKPYISLDENSRIKNMVHSIPDNVKIVTLSPAYNSYLSKYTAREIYAPGHGISQKIWGKSYKKMRYEKNTLCENLQQLSGNIFVYV